MDDLGDSSGAGRTASSQRLGRRPPDGSGRIDHMIYPVLRASLSEPDFVRTAPIRVPPICLVTRQEKYGGHRASEPECSIIPRRGMQPLRAHHL